LPVPPFFAEFFGTVMMLIGMYCIAIVVVIAQNRRRE
jgi:hypothetical protein